MVALIRFAVTLLSLFGAGAFATNNKHHDKGCDKDLTLDKAIKQGGKLYFGTATDRNTLSDPKINSIVANEFGSVTPENSMKWESTEPNPGNFTMGDADYLVNWAQKHGKKIRGHTLVWHSQLPVWVQEITDPKKLKAVMINHINKVAGRYRGKIYAWDVVNEIFNDDGTWRDSVFYRVLGPEFVNIAFHAAHAADPKAKLYMNDYNLDYAGPKVDVYVKLAKSLIKARVPIHGIGSQVHLIMNNESIDVIDQPLQALASTGLDLALTELDIRMQLPVTDRKLKEQRINFDSTLSACMSIRNCVGVTVWGVSDKYSWVPDVFAGEGAAVMYDENYNKKPAYTGAMEGIQFGA